jgi:hypothetical protein
MPYTKKLVQFLVCLLLFTACKREYSKEGCRNDAVITGHATFCGGWGIVVNGQVYPSDNIPEAFRQDSLKVCTDFSLYEDTRKCACCGGSYATILLMRKK